jgi:hypothetical protein
MATLQAPAENSNGFEIEDVAPTGDYIATCIDIADEFGVTRRKYQSEETEQIDVTRFLFGFKAQDGRLYKVQTFEMKISGSPKSALYKFLSSWLGKAPNMGWDYCELKGKGAVIKVEQVTSQMGKVYNKIVSILPPKTSLSDYTAQVIPVEQFAAVAQASAAFSAPAPAAAPAPASAPQAWSPDSGNEMDCPF